MMVQVVVLAVSLIVTLLFFLYGFNLYYLLRASAKYRSPDLPKLSRPMPRVSIHLPIYNEKYVIRRVVAACAGMAQEYGRESVRILVIDDSDDDTTTEVDSVVQQYLEKGIQVDVIRREGRAGFKAGALQLALDRTEEDFIAIFDADFIPSKDFLNRMMPCFAKDERLGIVQSRWTHVNRDYNMLTRAVAIGIDVHFFIEQPGRNADGCFMNFNGSGGVFRKQALLAAGGWQADTLAEDLDVSYRVQLQGYRILYLRDILSPGEVPATVPSFKRQQARWACGSLRTARKILPRLVADRRLSFKTRLEAFIHLTNYIVHPLMFVSFLLACMAAILQFDAHRAARSAQLLPYGAYGDVVRLSAAPAPQTVAWALLGSAILLCTVSAWVYPVVALRAQGLKPTRNLGSLLVLFLLGCGISLSNTIEAGKALFTNRDWAFKRTPKYAIQQDKGEWRGKAYQIPLDSEWLLELVLVCLGVLAMACAAWRSAFGLLPILAPYTAAYAFVAWLTVRQSRQEQGL